MTAIEDGMSLKDEVAHRVDLRPRDLLRASNVSPILAAAVAAHDVSATRIPVKSQHANVNRLLSRRPAPTRAHTPCDFVLRGALIPTTHSLEDADLGPGVLTDTGIHCAVHHLLEHADLTVVTKRQVRRQLEDHFRMELGNRKSAIKGEIDCVLLTRAS